MTEYFGGWVRAAALMAVICGLALMLTPRGRAGAVLKIVCVLVMIFSIIRPIMSRAMPSLSLNIAQYRQQAQEITNQTRQQEANLNRSIIERQCAAYILNKAQSMGVEAAQVSVLAKWSEGGCWYPYEVSLGGRASPQVKNSLRAVIAGELGIPAERQSWSDENG